jgi:lipid II:glycine glycyltransferase (peptidoglycan interpeptide bridge formation enzyme)
MILLINHDIDEKKWNELLSQSLFSSPFQTPEFYHFYNSLDGFSADVFAIEEDGAYKALAVVTIQKEKGVKSYFSRRGIIYGGFIFNKVDNLEVSSFLNEIKKYYKNKVIYLETRNYFDYSLFKDAFARAGFEYIPWLNFHLDTSDEGRMKKNMSSSRLRQVKKAIKNGASWQVADKEQDIVAFYNILRELYRSRIKKPLFPLAFFMEFHKQEIGKFLLVYYQNKVIGGIMCPIYPEKAIYEFYVCGLDSEYKNQYPSVMATWAAMEYANQNNIPLFDFMGAGSPEEAYGVREFKARFGGEQVEHGRYRVILNQGLFKLGDAGIKMLSKIKK